MEQILLLIFSKTAYAVHQRQNNQRHSWSGLMWSQLINNVLMRGGWFCGAGGKVINHFHTSHQSCHAWGAELNGSTQRLLVKNLWRGQSLTPLSLFTLDWPTRWRFGGTFGSAAVWSERVKAEITDLWFGRSSVVVADFKCSPLCHCCPSHWHRITSRSPSFTDSLSKTQIWAWCFSG